MATRDEMAKIITDMEDDIKGWPVRSIRYYSGRFPDVAKEIIWHILRHAESNGRRYNGYNGVYVKDEPCTYWLVGDYIVTHLTDNLDFNAEMLTEDMMDELIIEKA